MGRIESLKMYYDSLSSPSEPLVPTGVLKHLTSLKRLDLRFLQILGDFCRIGYAPDGSDFAHLTKLEELDVYSSFMVLDDAGLAELARCTHLTSLRLHGPHKISASGLQQLTSLHELTLDRWSLPGADLLGLSLPNLRRLYVVEAHLLTNASLQALGPSLHEQGLRDCPGVTADAFEHTPNLRKLSLEDCGGVNLELLPMVIGQRLPHLAWLRLYLPSRFRDRGHSLYPAMASIGFHKCLSDTWVR